MAPVAAAIAVVMAACWSPPVDAPVADPFRRPACTWCPGNRGIEYATRRATPVRVVERGRVSFAGSVAGVTHVVVTHDDGLRATYGWLASTRVRLGDTVAAGDVVGTSGTLLYFGLRSGDTAVDPTPRLGRWVRRARLVPLDGSPGRPSPARLVCRNLGLGR